MNNSKKKCFSIKQPKKLVREQDEEKIKTRKLLMKCCKKNVSQ